MRILEIFNEIVNIDCFFKNCEQCKYNPLCEWYMDSNYNYKKFSHHAVQEYFTIDLSVIEL